MDIKYDILSKKVGNGPWISCSSTTPNGNASGSVHQLQTMVSVGTSDTPTDEHMEDQEEVADDDQAQVLETDDGEKVDADETFAVEAVDIQQQHVTATIHNIPGDNVSKATVDHAGEDMPLDNSASQSQSRHCGSDHFPTASCSMSTSSGNSEHMLIGLRDTADPAHYSNCRVTPTVINLLLNTKHVPGEAQSFPIKNGRSCTRSWFFDAMPDGEKRVRKWLGYSCSTDSLFCIYCMLFAGPSSLDMWTRKGYTDWCHATRDITTHESSSQHHAAEMARFMWGQKLRIEDHMTTLQDTLTERSRRVVYVSIKCLKYLSSEMVAIRGHGSYDGKFLHLFSEFAEFEASAASYLEMLAGIRNRQYRNKPEVNLISPLNCRRLLITMRDMVVTKIVAAIENTRVCSLISDGTQDESKLEAQCVILRYLETTSCGLRPVERLVDIFTTGETSGLVLCERIAASLKDVHVPMKWLVGQSYDGAGNVRGKYTGLKTRILELAPRAVYIWCNAHRLNLVIETILKSSPDICNALGIVQELYNFFLGHRRHSILVEMQQGTSARAKTLKRVADTTRSWRSAEDGISTALECFDSIVVALKTLADNSQDTNTTASANGLLVKLHDSRFILTITFLKNIFRITGPMSRILQSKSADLSIAAKLIETCIAKLQKKRDKVEKFFKAITKESTEFCSEHAIKPELKVRRGRRMKRMADELSDDDRIQEVERAFKIEVVIGGLDVTLEQLKDRFTDQDVAFMREIHLFSPAGLTSSKSCTPKDVENICKFYSLDANVISRERNSFAPVYQSMASLLSVDDLLDNSSRLHKEHGHGTQNQSQSDEEMENNTSDSGEICDGDDDIELSAGRWLEHSFVKPLRAVQELSSYPNLLCLLKILVAIAVTSCSAERVMSRVKIIKNRLRSTMNDEWFSSLTILASERDIMDSLPATDIIDTFAHCSPKLQNMLGVQ
jgi:hypothetical protein